MRNRRTTLALLAAAALALTGCSASGSTETNSSDSSDPRDMAEVQAEPGTPNATVEVVADWTEVDSVFSQAYFRVIRVAGQCLIEEYHYENGSVSMVLAPEACER